MVKHGCSAVLWVSHDYNYLAGLNHIRVQMRYREVGLHHTGRLHPLNVANRVTEKP